ncbi:recombinase family protein [Candidatus Ruminimicrobium bovinum]|uniref:recombinase family protein n=1 Tax=Candidatus Ruminimicrobium bovinum TaxID=3242779 RepID=UPI0039B93B62
MVTKTKEVKSSREVKYLKREEKKMIKKNNEVKSSKERQNLIQKKGENKMLQNLTEELKMNNFIKKAEQAVGYCKASSYGTIKYSLEFQEKEILKYSKANNLQLTKSYKCIESSWNIKGREKIIDMLKYITKHPEIKHIIFYSEEIMNSNLLDTQRIYDFVRQNNKTIHFVKDKMKCIVSPSPEGLALTDLDIAVAKKISNDTSKKTKIGMLEKAKYGILPLKAPLGYINNPRTRMIDINNKIAQKIKEIFEILSKGKMTKEKFIKLSIKVGINPRKLINIIQNPFYFGKFFYKRKIYQGKHIPLIRESMWHKANMTLSKII